MPFSIIEDSNPTTTRANARSDGAGDPCRASSLDEFEATITLVLRRFPLQEADREDCRQSIWAELLGSSLDLTVEPNPGARLAALARNKAVDLLRVRRRRPHISLAFDVDRADVDDREAERERASAIVWAALGRLEDGCDPATFLVFFLRWIEGWSITEAATFLGLSPGQARQRHHRLKGKFRDLVEADASSRVRTSWDGCSPTDRSCASAR
jgi:RNA polymerase sigma factor (sigma-70 family)